MRKSSQVRTEGNTEDIKRRDDNWKLRSPGAEKLGLKEWRDGIKMWL